MDELYSITISQKNIPIETFCCCKSILFTLCFLNVIFDFDKFRNFFLYGFFMTKRNLDKPEPFIILG